MGDYKLKFLFANHDGVSVELAIPETTTISQLKAKLLNESWPEDKVEKASSPAGIRLLCMGRMLEDSKTLAEMKIQRYEHPTPVNVALLPKGKVYSEGANPGNSSPVLKSTIPAGAASPAQARAAPDGAGGCCTIS
jgi:hypothetical protein